MKKRIFVVVLVVMMLLALGGCGKKKNGTLRVGMECDYAPFNWTQTNKTKDAIPLEGGGYADGYDVRIAQIIADGLGMELEVVKIEWGGLTMALEAGQIDAIIAGMSPTAERALTIDFSDPYYESELVIVVRKDSVYANAASLSDFSGAKITGQLSTFHYSVIDQIPGVVKLNAMETFPAMIVALTAGGIDGYVSERPGALSAVAANSNLTFVEFDEGKGFEASPEDVAISVGLKKGSDLREKINQILQDVTKKDRQELMDWAIENQPLSE